MSRNLTPSLVICGLLFAAANAAAADAPDLAASINAIRVDSPVVELRGPQSRYSLLVDGTGPEGRIADLTHQAAFRALAPEIFTVSPTGVITAVTDGVGRVEVTAANQTVFVDVKIRDTQQPRAFHFERDIVPILSRYACNGSGCHGKAEGQNGFKLSVFGFDPAADYTALLQESRGRRVSRTQPDDSLLLTKISGRLPHGGGVRLRPDSLEYGLIRDWIAAGAPLGTAELPQYVSIELSPKNRQMAAGGTQQLRVIATDSAGTKFDVTPLAKFQSNHDGLAAVDELGLVTAGKTPGDVAVMAAFLGFVDVFRVLIPQTESTDKPAKPPAINFIDELVDAKLLQLNVTPSGLCTDAEFLSRAAPGA